MYRIAANTSRVCNTGRGSIVQIEAGSPMQAMGPIASGASLQQ